MSDRGHIVQNKIYCHIEDAIAEILEGHGVASPTLLDAVVEWVDSNYRGLSRWESVLRAEAE